MNRVVLIGRLGKDPELRYTPSGTAIAKFSLATDRRKRHGEEQPPDWHRIIAWGRLGEICSQYLIKGERVMIEGRIEYGSYEKDGVKYYITDIIAEEMEMLGSPGNPDPGEFKEPTRLTGDAVEDIPF
jgi:single-strand DNA-binding protein